MHVPMHVPETKTKSYNFREVKVYHVNFCSWTRNISYTSTNNIVGGTSYVCYQTKNKYSAEHHPFPTHDETDVMLK